MAHTILNMLNSKKQNDATFVHYFTQLVELSLSMFEWTGLPDSVDPRFLELILFSQGRAIFFKDTDLTDNTEDTTLETNREYHTKLKEVAEVNNDKGLYLALMVANAGEYDVYHIPKRRHAYASNGYMHSDLTGDNSVIIYNNMLHTPAQINVEHFASRLAQLDRVGDINVNAQKTPILIKGTEKQRLTLKNLYQEYDGNSPFIFGDKELDPNVLQSINTNAPFLADKLQELKTVIWNEALTYLGISNISNVKKERMITDEVTRNLGGTIASRYSRLLERQKACAKINKMFNLNVRCEYRDDFQHIDDSGKRENPDGDLVDMKGDDNG